MKRLTLFSALTAFVLGALAFMHAPAQAWSTEVIAYYTCHYGKVTATLVWSGNSPHAVGQYVQMSYTDDGWRPHTTTSVGPFHPSINTMAWDGLHANTRHFLRFVQQLPDGTWDASHTFRVDTPSCGADGFTVTFDFFSFAGDYDCAAGSGNGPNFIEGPIGIRGNDIYGLDADGDGIACEAGGP